MTTASVLGQRFGAGCRSLLIITTLRLPLHSVYELVAIFRRGTDLRGGTMPNRLFERLERWRRTRATLGWLSSARRAIRAVLGPRWSRSVGVVWAALTGYAFIADQIPPELDLLAFAPPGHPLDLRMRCRGGRGSGLATALFAYAALECVVRLQRPWADSEGRIKSSRTRRNR